MTYVTSGIKTKIKWGALIIGLLFILSVFILLFIFRRPKLKGAVGERIVSSSNSIRLNKTKYKQLNNITLLLRDGSTTQIDHIILSKYGIFVLETKNMKGEIYGEESQKEWAQHLFNIQNKFQNPIFQNYRHIKSLQETTKLPSSCFISVVVFVGECSFASPLPKGVYKGLSYISYIKSFSQEMLKESELSKAMSDINARRLKNSHKTDRLHIQNLKARHAAKNIANKTTKIEEK